MKEMAELYKEGLIGSIGLSNGNPEQIALACKILEENGAHLDAIQNHYSLFAMEREASTLAFCKEHGILFFGYMLLVTWNLSQRALIWSLQTRRSHALKNLRSQRESSRKARGNKNENTVPKTIS